MFQNNDNQTVYTTLSIMYTIEFLRVIQHTHNPACLRTRDGYSHQIPVILMPCINWVCKQEITSRIMMPYMAADSKKALFFMNWSWER